MLKNLPRIAAAGVALQIVIGAIAIFMYALMQPKLQCEGTGLLAGAFRAAFPIPADNVEARTMFDCLFVPLSYLYIISVVVLLAMLPREIGSIIRSLKEHRALIGGIIIFVGGSYFFLFGPTEYAIATKTKRQVLDGRMFGYFTFFCGWPFGSILILMNLPSNKSKVHHISI